MLQCVFCPLSPSEMLFVISFSTAVWQRQCSGCPAGFRVKFESLWLNYKCKRREHCSFGRHSITVTVEIWDEFHIFNGKLDNTEYNPIGKKIGYDWSAFSAPSSVSLKINFQYFFPAVFALLPHSTRSFSKPFALSAVLFKQTLNQKTWSQSSCSSYEFDTAVVGSEFRSLIMTTLYVHCCGTVTLTTNLHIYSGLELSLYLQNRRGLDWIQWRYLSLVCVVRLSLWCRYSLQQMARYLEKNWVFWVYVGGAALVVAAPLCVRTVEPERMSGAAGG